MIIDKVEDSKMQKKKKKKKKKKRRKKIKKQLDYGCGCY